jgi:hypothetical protein
VIGVTVAHGRIDKHAVMLALYFWQRVIECAQEILVGGNDRTVEIELDDRLRPADCIRLSECVAYLCFAAWVEHSNDPGNS